MWSRSVVTLTIALLGAALAPLSGQQPAFEVASIKVNHSGGRGGHMDLSRPGTLEATNSTLQACIRWAYDVQDFQIIGAPGWLDGDRYDIFAKAPTANTSVQEKKRMLQALLVVRLGLQVHREKKKLPTYLLFVGKGGPKLQATTVDFSSASSGSGSIRDRGATAALLAAQLSSVLGQIVIDKTALTEKYDFKLEWEPDLDAQSAPGPSLFSALQELGLKLESAKGDVEVLVIDHIERVPTEN